MCITGYEIVKINWSANYNQLNDLGLYDKKQLQIIGSRVRILITNIVKENTSKQAASDYSKKREELNTFRHTIYAHVYETLNYYIYVRSY